MGMQRLDKLLCSQGLISRREAGKCIREGRVTVDGSVCRTPDRKVDPVAETVAVDGRPILYKDKVYIMLNKPAGILCVSRDPKAPTVVDLLPDAMKRRGLFPAGRLDKDTVGLVLLTDDGDYAHRVLSPKKEIYKQYLVRLDGPLDETAAELFRQGITLSDGTLCRPARLYFTDTLDRTEMLVEICEGRFHQIKRMFASLGRQVVFLERRKMGSLCLDETLPRGCSRELTQTEKEAVFYEKL